MAFSAGAIAVIAVDWLDASSAQVAVVFAVAGLAAAAASLPVGPFVERRTKRPVLVEHPTDLDREFAVPATHHVTCRTEP